jgi:hypothetical protein
MGDKQDDVIFLEQVCILEGGEGMDIHDAINAIVVLLKLHIILDSPQVVAYVLLACGPGA